MKGHHDGDMITVARRWRARDLEVLWHPCTQMREHGIGMAKTAQDESAALPLLTVARGEGAWLIGHDGRRVLDAVSSWWTNLHGHAEPRIAHAIARQTQTLEQVILAGCTHEPPSNWPNACWRSHHDRRAARPWPRCSTPTMAPPGSRSR